MKKRNNWLAAVMVMTLGLGVIAAGCGQSAETQQAAENTDTSEKENTAQSESIESGAADLNAMTLDEITEKAKDIYIE